MNDSSKMLEELKREFVKKYVQKGTYNEVALKQYIRHVNVSLVNMPSNKSVHVMVLLRELQDVIRKSFKERRWYRHRLEK